MSTAAVRPWFPVDSDARRRPFVVALLILGCGATVAAVIAGNGSVAAAVAPPVAAAVLAAIWIAPLRVTLLSLILLGLALDTPDDAASLWQSPVAPLGRLLMENLNRTIPVEALRITLMALVLGYLLLIHIHRLLSGSRIDKSCCDEAASPLMWALAISSLTLLGLCVYGVSRGGAVQICNFQGQTFVLLLLMTYLLAVSLAGPQDYKTLGRVIVFAACAKALMAVWVRLTVMPPDMEVLESATTHGDSMLFVCAVGLLVALFFEQPVRRNLRPGVLFVPVVLAGMVANDRRLAWVEVSAVVMTLCIISPRTRLKRSLIRAGLLALPFVLAYGVAGWGSSSRLFAPVQLVRSIAEPQSDRSTWDRDIENFNLIYTLSLNPLLGTGFGHPYVEVVKGDDITRFFKEYRFLPHNSVLGLWSWGGMPGFTGLTAVLVVGLLLAARSYVRARSPMDRVVAFSAIATVLVYVIQCWGDMGFAEKKSIFLVGPALAVAGQLATATGAWPGRHPSQPASSS